ncbi:hypothetical protein [Peribacillus sp. NPDC058002]|uniref:hypothetical protein n=1 Tax=Peribacillus sp. NPDC058002 TaxID=3346301 RepID=UPI0036DC0DB2
MVNQEGSKVKVVPNMPEGKCRISSLSYDSVKDKGVTASAIAHASWTWGKVPKGTPI